MPAYFSLSFEMCRGPAAIRDFCTALTDAGLAFKSGYWGFESDTLEDIIRWNQNKLDGNFQLGFTEDRTHDYKQMLFDYGDFSEIRVFVLNEQKDPVFHFELIIAEDDFVKFTREGGELRTHRRTDRMDDVKALACRVWRGAEILAVQTSWECSAYPPDTVEIAAGAQPQAEPFCILARSVPVRNLKLPAQRIARGGMLIEDRENWKY